MRYSTGFATSTIVGFVLTCWLYGSKAALTFFGIGLGIFASIGLFTVSLEFVGRIHGATTWRCALSEAIREVYGRH